MEKHPRIVGRMFLAATMATLGSELAITLGQVRRFYGPLTAGVLHVLVMSIALVAIVLVGARALRRARTLRNESQHLLEEREARLRLQFDRMPVPCLTASREGVVTSWNAAAERTFGYAAEEIIGSSCGALLPHGFTTDLEGRWERLLAGDSSAHGINENVTKDGRIIVCRWTNTPLVDGDGRVVAVLSMAEDITEERRMQATLAETEARHRAMLDQLPHFIFSVDADDRYTVANAATCRFFGREESEIIGRTPQELGVDPDLARRWSDQKARTRQTRETQTLDLTIATDNGPRSYRAITSPVLDAAGNVASITGISIDMTEQRSAEAAAHRLLNAVERLDEVVFTTDREGRINHVNPAFTRVYGYSRQEVIGCTPRILKSGEVSAEQYASLWTELVAGRSIRTEFRNRRKDGSIADMIVSASPILEGDGTISGFIAVQNDVTEQKRIAAERERFEERVEHLARMEGLGTLAGGMAHDFNNILSIVLSHVSILERRSEDRAAVARVASTIQQAVKRGASLTRQILTFARRADTKIEDVNLARLIMELGSMISETFPRTIELTLDLDPDLPVVRADAGQLHQALLNLCVNARDAMPTGGELTIRACVRSASSNENLLAGACGERLIEISVADTGIGIDEETRKRIFEPFFTTKEKGKGTGLGLAVVFGVASSHGGSVDVQSSVGVGTVFRLCLPLAAAEAPDSSCQQCTDVAGGTESLLVIEDEPLLLHSVSAQLRAYGYQVCTAANGVDALDQLRNAGECLPDAVIMDLGMPRMSAVDLIRAVREIASGIPIVAMTGYVDPDVHASVVAAGVGKIVSKPFEMSELLAGIRNVLRTSKRFQVAG